MDPEKMGKFEMLERTSGLNVVKYDDLRKSKIVYKNDINFLSLSDFTAKEIDLLMFIFALCKDRYNNVIQVNYKDVRKCIKGNSHLTKNELHEIIENVSRKYITMYFFTRYNNTTTNVSIFSFITSNKDEQLLSFKVNPDFLYLFNEIDGEFFTFKSIEELSYIKSKYAKMLHKLLSQWRYIGKLTINYSDLKETLMSAAVENKKFNMKLKTVVQELNETNLYQNLKCEFIRGNSRNIESVIFTFKKEENSLEDDE